MSFEAVRRGAVVLVSADGPAPEGAFFGDVNSNDASSSFTPTVVFLCFQMIRAVLTDSCRLCQAFARWY